MLTASAIASLPKLPPVNKGSYCSEENNSIRCIPRRACTLFCPSNGRRELIKIAHSGLLGYSQLGFDTSTHSVRTASMICAAALNARCAAEQTQTVTRQAPTITHIPGKEKEKSPQLDDGGAGFPPRDDGDGGGGGGGGGGNWSGGFFFFGFLAFLGFLKDKESEGPYEDDRRR